MKKLELNEPAPDFTGTDQNNNQWNLAAQRGKWVVLYFYPKDDTPGCTVEACSLRDTNNDLAEQGATVVGVSADNVSSHIKFAEKHDLNFSLLSDPDMKIIKLYTAWGPKMFGRKGILRKTFLIDPDGIIRKIYGRVTPHGHGEQVLKEIQSYKSE